MAYVYFPGCKYTALSPATSKKMQEYLKTKRNMAVTGCCSVNHKQLTSGDKALVVCPTCLFKLSETAPQSEVLSVWEVLADDDGFPWPDYKGKAITIQDCVDTADNPEWQQAVRKVLMRMNVHIVEIEKSFEKADFCNIETSASPLPKEEQMEQLVRHCEEYTTDMVVCYCTGCLNSLRIGGVNGIHLVDLVMGNIE